MRTSIAGALLALPLLAAALPATLNPGQSTTNNPAARKAAAMSNILHSGTITAEDIIKVAPATASCAGRGSQCVTAAQAAPAIANSFKKWGIISFGSQAAVVSTLLYESGNFEYDTPVLPTSGKGTRDMQSAAFNAEYAAAVGLSTTSEDVATDEVVAALNKDLDTSFGSGAWLLSAHCPMSIRDQMHAQESAGYQNYVEQCLDTSELAERQQIWDSLLALKQW
ncbi:MAG: hypothetical protein M1821_007145 [Bathelium mastoideum]|nr:MAG: hypothetical protein M1821_007145 [Bathelium mastoideum]KAI9694655.1 MAG: hypothetical protein M1822_000271 [Bathelium mastoideum]